MLRRMGWVLAFLAAVPAGAQERVDELDLPRSVADEVIDFFNHPSTVRFRGPAEVPEGRVIRGQVAVLTGPFVVAGEIQGDLVVVNGDLEVLPGGLVTGDVTVIGGQVRAEAGAVGGQLTVYGEALAYRRRGERIAYDERPWSGRSDLDSRGRSYLSIRHQGNYNRVEGLPVLFGPVFRSEGGSYLRADVMGIWRSDSGLRLDADEMGYFVRAAQHFGPSGRMSIGATAHSLVTPIEDGGLRDLEASLATFLLHRDYRDYYDREGFSAFLRYDDDDSGVRLTAEYRDEEHAFAPVGSPWTLKDDEDAWRPQPLVGEGRLRTVGGEIRVDDRNDRDDPSDGWYLVATAIAGIGGDLELPGYRMGEPTPPNPVADPRPLDTDFTAGSFDLRRYTRLGPGSDLRLRGFVAGSLDGSQLPPQFQRTLGGEGSLPGYPLMSMDCGARARDYSVFLDAGDDAVRVPTFAGYGCDRVALFQAEYRGTLTFDTDWGGDDQWNAGWGWYPPESISPSWSLFFDAGRGWSVSELGAPGRLGPDPDTFMDVGFGVFLGDVGVYWAWPLNGEDRNVNFFVRIDHRF